MFVYKYPDWVGQIIFDGWAAVSSFDGAKDLFKYYFDILKSIQSGNHPQKDITAILCHGIL